MAHLRFERVRDVIDAFPSVVHELDIEPSDEGSLDFLSSLAIMPGYTWSSSDFSVSFVLIGYSDEQSLSVFDCRQ